MSLLAQPADIAWGHHDKASLRQPWTLGIVDLLLSPGNWRDAIPEP